MNSEMNRVPKFPEDVYTEKEIIIARRLVRIGYQHKLKIVGSSQFKKRISKSLELIEKAGYYRFLSTYIRTIEEIEGLSQLREAKASIWTNIHMVEDAIESACFLFQKANQMKRYIEETVCCGVKGEILAMEDSKKFLEKLLRSEVDLRTKLECKNKIKAYEEGKFL